MLNISRSSFHPSHLLTAIKVGSVLFHFTTLYCSTLLVVFPGNPLLGITQMDSALLLKCNTLMGVLHGLFYLKRSFDPNLKSLYMAIISVSLKKHNAAALPSMTFTLHHTQYLSFSELEEIWTMPSEMTVLVLPWSWYTDGLPCTWYFFDESGI